VGEPAVPSDATQKQALTLAKHILEAIRNDESPLRITVKYLQFIGYDPNDPGQPIVDTALWLLAYSLILKVEPHYSEEHNS
jgi:hypothetical protein